jgi:hypothetical protein
MPEWLRHFFDAAKVDSTKSSALAPLQWLTGICFAGGIGVTYATGSAWIAALSILLPVGLAIFYCWAYVWHMKNNPDALRSEKYSLHKIAMEKGLIGDNMTGMRPDEETDNTDDEPVPQLPNIANPATNEGTR